MRNLTIWITGSEGKLGSAMLNILKKDHGYKVIGTDKDVDITDIQAVRAHAGIYRPNIIINCAAVIGDQYCEEHMLEAYKVNTLGARNLAMVSNQLGITMIQMSTDDVFSGETRKRLTEFDTPRPNTVYGKSKLAAETYVRDMNPKHLIIRSAWVYGLTKGDYYNTVLEYAKAGKTFESPLDMVSTPTSVERLAECVRALLEHGEYGIIHASAEGMCTRYEFARTILSMNGYDPDLVTGTMSQANGGASYTLLENLMLKMTGVYEMPEWRSDLQNYVNKTKGAN